MIVCSVCGTENPDGAKYCEGCGVELQAQAAGGSGSSSAAPHPTAPAQGQAPAVESSTSQSGSGPVEAPPLEPIPGDAQTAGLPPQGEAASAAPVEAPTPDPAPPSAAALDIDVGPLVEEQVAAGSSAVISPGTPVQAEAAGPAVPTPHPDPLSAGSSSSVSAAAPSPAPAVGEGQGAPPVAAPPASTPLPAATMAVPHLMAKRYGALTGETMPLNGSRVTVGRFDPSTGPVDLDLSSMPGNEHVSRHHAELYLENGHWMVRDLGSTNGVYVKRPGDEGFGPRLQSPQALTEGDEIAFGNISFVFRQGSDGAGGASA